MARKVNGSYLLACQDCINFTDDCSDVCNFQKYEGPSIFDERKEVPKPKHVAGQKGFINWVLTGGN